MLFQNRTSGRQAPGSYLIQLSMHLRGDIKVQHEEDHRIRAAVPRWLATVVCLYRLGLGETRIVYQRPPLRQESVAKTSITQLMKAVHNTAHEGMHIHAQLFLIECVYGRSTQ